MRGFGLKVGELAKRTGLTIRTLHHYDEIGLVRPSLHTDSGHRLYTARDVTRLQQVLSLRQLGFSLEQARDCLDRPEFSPSRLIDIHIARLRGQIALEQKLCERLEAISRRLHTAGDISADEFIQTIEEMNMIENYYTADQLEYLKNRREEVGEERMRQAPADWANLIAEVRAKMHKETDPAAPEVQELARRWLALIAEFTGGDAGIAQSLGNFWTDQGDKIAAQHGNEHDPRGVYEYIGRSIAIVKGSP